MCARNTAGSAYELVDGGTGGGSFDLHDDVTTELTSDLENEDRFLVSNESAADDPNRYITAQNLIAGLPVASMD